MELTSLGIDLASRSWADTGSALLGWREAMWTRVEPGCIRGEGPLSPQAMAQHIDRFARHHGVAIVSIDGPQGWREPEAPLRPGVGRASEYAACTQGKTGAYGRAYPRTQRGWMEFCIAVFDALLSRPGVALAPAPGPVAPRAEGYWLVECFPTRTWRTLGLRPLPGKRSARAAQVERWRQDLWARLALPPVQRAPNHDELQAVVAAAVGAAVVGGPLAPAAHGKAAWRVEACGPVPAHRVEGLIWDVAVSRGRAARRAGASARG